MKAILLSAAALAALAAAAPAHAKLACYRLAQIEQALEAEYGERPQFAGREVKASGDGIEYRLYVNRETGSWSWIGIPSGTDMACLIFAGTRPSNGAVPDKPAAPDLSAAPQARF